ncbi:MAG: hypothetical protein AAB583_07000 [Patescibacteria group bacterium]
MKEQTGQTLLEILLALGASVMILSAIAVIVVSSLNSTRFTKNQNLANQYAQEGIEIVRRTRDSGGWAGFPAGTYCLSSGSTSLPASSVPPCATANVGIFIRQIDIIASDCPGAGGGPSGSRVKSKVSWIDGKCPDNDYCHKVELISCFYNINQKPAP